MTKTPLIVLLTVITCPLILRGAEPITHRVIAADSATHRVAIFEPDGRMSWEHPIRNIHDLHVLPSGNVLFQTDMQHLVEVTPNKQVVWSYDASSMNGNAGRPVQMHAFQRLADGLTMIAESGPARIIEVDAAGVIHHEIKLHVDHPHVHRDTRLARKLDNGHYLVAHEGDGAVREYDGDGNVVWAYDVPMFGGKAKGGHGPEAYGNQVFAALRLPGGNTLIATGNGHRLLEVTPAKQIVWKLEQNELPGITLAWVTTLQALANGHIVFGNCHAGPNNPQIIEITREKQVVWTLKNFEQLGNATSNSQILDAPGSIR